MTSKALLLPLMAALLFSCNNNESSKPADTNRETGNAVERTAPAATADSVVIRDYGAEPFVFDIEAYTKENNTFRTALWTGKHMQMTLMSLKSGEEIGLEQHNELDQFIRIEEGDGTVYMGDSRDALNFQRAVEDDFAFFIPAGKWHNLVNTGDKPLKLYSIYTPTEHPHGTIHSDKAAALAAEKDH